MLLLALPVVNHVTGVPVAAGFVVTAFLAIRNFTVHLLLFLGWPPLYSVPIPGPALDSTHTHTHTRTNAAHTHTRYIYTYVDTQVHLIVTSFQKKNIHSWIMPISKCIITSLENDIHNLIMLTLHCVIASLENNAHRWIFVNIEVHYDFASE